MMIKINEAITTFEWATFFNFDVLLFNLNAIEVYFVVSHRT